jgi:hypothetical protein
MRRLVLVVALVASAGSSSDPNGSAECVTGHVAQDGPVCTALRAPMVIDGDPSDFRQQAIYDTWNSPFGGPCEPDGCALIWVRDGDTLVFNGARFGGTSLFEAYSILFADGDYDVPDDETRYVEIFFGASEVRTFIGSYEMFGVPIEFAFTPSGWEVRVPLDILPYASGSALVDTYTWRLMDGIWQRGPGFGGWLGYACWDASVDDNACTLF